MKKYISHISLIRPIRLILKRFTAIPKRRRVLLRAGLIAIAILLPLAIMILRNATNIKAQWWDDGWLYRKSIAISYSGSTTLTDFQVELNEVDVDGLYASGKLQADCDDLRFTDINGQLLDYWIEDESDSSDTLDCTASDYDIWVKVPSIPQGGTAIYMYYSNSQAQAYSDGDKAFPMFENFTTSTLDTVRWNQNGSINEAEQIANMLGSSLLTLKGKKKF